MENGSATAGYLLRLVGFMGIAVGVAWALQTLAFGHESLGSELMWVVAAASVAGAGAGLIVASGAISETTERLAA